MQEIEAKILEINRTEIQDKLVRMGAMKEFDGEMETFFYDFKDGSIVKAKNVLRLRREDKKIVLTYKTVTGNKQAKTAEEYSVVVSDLSTTQKILERLGLVVIDTMKKHRISYKLEDASFDIDRYLEKYSYIPEFLEIEAKSIASVYEYAEVLGFRAEQCLPWSTMQVIEHYAGRKK